MIVLCVQRIFAIFGGCRFRANVDGAELRCLLVEADAARLVTPRRELEQASPPRAPYPYLRGADIL